MNDHLKNLIKFFKENNPEAHYQSNGGEEDSVWVCVSKFEAPEFLDIIEHIDDGGFECSWMGDYFGVDLTGFIEGLCDISLEDFCLIVDIEKE